MTVIEVDHELSVKTCEMYGYNYVVINSNDFVIPPREYDTIQANKI
jgi:hypothetical protein